MTIINDQQQPAALGTCARCDQPATVAITDAPGNARCDVHAAAIFQGATAGGEIRDDLLLTAQAITICGLRFEVAKLRTDLAQAQAEQDLWLQENDRLRLALAALDPDT